MKTMKTMLSLAMLLAVFCSTQVRGDETKAAAKTVTVKLKSLELALPTTWVKSDQVSSMRLATYEIPAAEGDTDKGELSVFSCLLYTSPSPRDVEESRMPSSA